MHTDELATVSLSRWVEELIQLSIIRIFWDQLFGILTVRMTNGSSILSLGLVSMLFISPFEYLTTYSRQILIQTPTDLQMQSSNHNTNGAVCYVSVCYVLGRTKYNEQQQ